MSTGDLHFRDPAAPSHQFVIGLSRTTDRRPYFSLKNDLKITQKKEIEPDGFRISLETKIPLPDDVSCQTYSGESVL